MLTVQLLQGVSHIHDFLISSPQFPGSTEGAWPRARFRAEEDHVLPRTGQVYL